jgi:O-methyltransferase involved in polyketide biosynthesis
VSTAGAMLPPRMAKPSGPPPVPPPPPPAGDLSVTALYTSATWAWGGLAGAELLDSADGRRVFAVTNAALGMARLFRPEMRSLRHSLLHRHAMIDHLLHASGARQVIELAAGLSRRGVAFSSDPAVQYTEVDLAPVMARKRALLERTPEGRAALARPNLHLVAADVREAPLDDRVRPGELFVIAEGLCMYLDPAGQRDLWRKVRGLLARAPGGTFVFDLVPKCEEPEPGVAGRTLEWLMKRFTGGRSFERDARTRGDIAGELGAMGFGVETVEPPAVAEAWGLPFPEVPSRQLLFVARA